MSFFLALERIKIPTNIINFIISLFYNRQISIITCFGLTQPFTGNDGIDQSETISPLLWQIFYDPLLCRINDDSNLGINIKINWPSGIINKPILTISEKIAASAYMDDTIWIASSKSQ